MKIHTIEFRDLEPGLAITPCGNTRRDQLPPTLATYEQGVRGNTHMMMMDLNNLQVADWILAWVEKNVAKKPVAVSRK